jgi:hypothetical protein
MTITQCDVRAGTLYITRAESLAVKMEDVSSFTYSHRQVSLNVRI